MGRRKQIKFSMSNQVLKGWQRKGIESEFIELGELGLAVYFMLLQRMAGENITYTTINMIIEALGLRREQKKVVIKALEKLSNLNLIECDKEIESYGNNNTMKIEMETNLKYYSYTMFYPDNFNFYRILGSKGFALFCMIESFIGNSKEAWCSVNTLSDLTGFSEVTTLKYIYAMAELGIYNVTYGEYDSQLKRNGNNIYKPNKMGRIHLLGKDLEEALADVDALFESYKDRKSERQERIDNYQSEQKEDDGDYEIPF